MHIRFEDKTLLAECRRQPGAPLAELAKQLGVTEKRISQLRARIQRKDNPKSYFIADQQGRVKIGKSVDPVKRFKYLQTNSADDLTLLGICDHEVKELHNKFNEYHLSEKWFQLSDEIKAWIQENAEVPKMQS